MFNHVTISHVVAAQYIYVAHDSTFVFFRRQYECFPE